MNNGVSIIVPAFNAQETIGRCLRSLLKQTYSNIEIIVIDDGSVDKTQNVCLNFRDNRISYFKKENNGVSSARNLGIEKAKFDYICFVDSDDYVRKNYVKQMVEHINVFDAVICGFYIKKKLYFRKICFKKKQILNWNRDYNIIRELSQNKLLNVPFNKMFKKSLILNVFDEELKMGEDLLFNLLYLSESKNIFCEQKCQYVYDCTKTSATRKFRENILFEEIALLKKINWTVQKKFSNVTNETLRENVISSFDYAFLSLFLYFKEEKDIKERILKWTCNDEFISILDLYKIDFPFRDVEKTYLRYKIMFFESKNFFKRLFKSLKKYLNML